jgi:hypothetical protein
LSIGSPLVLVTAILYYFGWVRTRVQAQELGYDASVLNFSVTDYLLKSVNVLFPLVASVLLVATVAHAIYWRFVRRALRTREGRQRLNSIGRAMRYLAILSLLTGLGLFLFVPDARFAALPFSVTASVLFVLAGRSIQFRATGNDPWSDAGRFLVLTLLALLIFWDTERIARFLGEQYAADIVAYPQQFAAVTIYSQQDLNLAADGVTSQVLEGTGDGAYRFEYSGLRLMERSADRYVLINEIWSNSRGRVIVLKDNDKIRIEFSYPYY